MYAKSKEKRELILEEARNVFLQKGFAATSMTDITEACQISRGGLYFYFSSVEEILIEVLRTRRRTTADMFHHLIDEETSFPHLLQEYFSYQKERLLNMDRSLLSATIEYGLYHRQPADKELVDSLYQSTKEIICDILQFGVRDNLIPADKLDALADHVLFLIEGLSIKAMTAGIDEETIDTQLTLLAQQILSSTQGGTR